MKVNFEIYFENDLMVWTDSSHTQYGGMIMESEVSITVNVDLTHVIDMICIIVLLSLFM